MANQSSDTNVNPNDQQGMWGHPPAAAIQAALKGIHYPASRQDLVNQAQQNGAPDGLLNWIKGLPQDQFGGPQDVQKAFGKEDTH